MGPGVARENEKIVVRDTTQAGTPRWWWRRRDLGASSRLRRDGAVAPLIYESDNIPL